MTETNNYNNFALLAALTPEEKLQLWNKLSVEQRSALTIAAQNRTPTAVEVAIKKEDPSIQTGNSSIELQRSNWNPYDAVRIEGFKIVVDEDALRLDYTPDFQIPVYTPKLEIAPYETLRRLYVDIETSGLDPAVDRVYMVGLLLDGSEPITITDPDERELLQQTLTALKKLKPQILALHNGFNFDLPFLMERWKHYEIRHPFKLGKYPQKITSASINGEPIEFVNVIWKGVDIIDTFQQAGIHDKMTASLDGYGLKDVAIAIGARSERRLELTHQQITECWESGDLDTIREYLIYDLEDTKSLADFLCPQVYYQRQVIPMSIQDLGVSSPAKKWEMVLEDHYRFDFPEPDEPRNYEGGYVLSNRGIYADVSKIDVSSMYPSIQLTYGLTSQKDADKYYLGALLWMTKFRLELKAKAKTDKKYKAQEKAIKILINGGYGFSGTGGYPYNCFATAALVTAYGRKLIKLMMAQVSEMGGTVINCFTADTMILTDKGCFPISELLDKKVRVLNGDRDWSEVEFKNYGRDRVWEVKLKRNRKTETIRCTSNHRWLVTKNCNAFWKNKPQIEVTTSELKPGMLIDNQFSQRPELNQDYYDGVAHGVIYGDGSFTKGSCNQNELGSCYTIQLVEEKEKLADYLYKASNGTVTAEWYRDEVVNSMMVRFYSHIELKKLPTGASNSYLLGFVRGLIATDGSVSGKDGCVDVSGQKDVVEFIRQISSQIGMSVSRINVSTKAGKTTEIRGKKCIQKTDNYKVFFECSSLTSGDLLREFHRKKWLSVHSGDTPSNPKWKVLSVAETVDVEDVYCCVEQKTHVFTLSPGIVTKNCDTDGVHFSTTDSPYTDEEICDSINAILPAGVSVGLEDQGCSMYAPKAKNYLIIAPDGKIQKKGVFKKRNRCALQREFPIAYIQKYLEDPQVAEQYFSDVVDSLRSGKYPIEALTFKHKISRSDKRLSGAELGKAGEVVSYYWGEEKRFHSRSGKPIKSDRKPIKSGDYWRDWYVLEVWNLRNQILEVATGEEHEEYKIPIPIDPNGSQLDLFAS